jgi:DNA-binding XRE family transcriptional regulator
VKKRNKYWPLSEYLRSSEREEILLSFASIESLIHSALPLSARTSRAWWSNRGEGSLQASSWMKHGYRVMNLNLAEESVTFCKFGREYKVQREGEIVKWDDSLIKALRLHMNLSQAELAEKLGVRQQTISEWEKNLYTPRRSMSKYLTIIAKQVNFQYIEGD